MEHKPDRYFHIPGANERGSFLCVCMSMVREQLSPSWCVHSIIQGVHDVCVSHRRGFLYLWQVATQTIWSASEETDQAPDYTLEDKCQSEKEESPVQFMGMKLDSCALWAFREAGSVTEAETEPQHVLHVWRFSASDDVPH